jgi:hypothetical protein
LLQTFHSSTFTCLRDVLTRLPNMTNHQIPEVIPQAWAKAQPPLQSQGSFRSERVKG